MTYQFTEEDIAYNISILESMGINTVAFKEQITHLVEGPRISKAGNHTITRDGQSWDVEYFIENSK